MSKINRAAQDRQIRMVLEFIKSSGPLETFSDVLSRVRKSVDFKVGGSRILNIIEAEQLDKSQLFKARKRVTIMEQLFHRIDTLQSRVSELERRLTETSRS